MTPTQLIPPLVEEILKKDLSQLDDQLGNLIEENHALGGTQYGFLFHGEFMTKIQPRLQRGAEKRPVHPSMMSAVSRYAAALKQINVDRVRMTQGLSLLVRPCRSIQDLRDALPSVLKSMLKEISSLPRTRPEAYTLEGRELQLHDYKATEDLVALYVANQLLY